MTNGEVLSFSGKSILIPKAEGFILLMVSINFALITLGQGH